MDSPIGLEADDAHGEIIEEGQQGTKARDADSRCGPSRRALAQTRRTDRVWRVGEPEPHEQRIVLTIEMPVKKFASWMGVGARKSSGCVGSTKNGYC